MSCQVSLPVTAAIFCLGVVVPGNVACAQRQMERLSRGVSVVATGEGQHLVSWRLLATDPGTIGFHLYCRVSGQAPERVNKELIVGATNCLVSRDDDNADVEYFVRSVTGGVEGDASPSARVWQEGYLEIPIQTIDRYRPGDASAADLDGDGEYEIILQQSGLTHDNAHSGLTDAPILDGYELDGTHLWRINLGKNIRDGEHYTQFMAYDLDGDGKAEVACKTADGSIDGQGNIIGDAAKDWRTTDEQSRSFGRVLAGPEFLTIFDGQTGEAVKTMDYLPARDPIDGWGGIGGNGGNDSYGNRCDRFLACVAYLDGRLPSLVMCRGVYGRTVMVAWDWRDGDLTQRWVFDSKVSYPPYGDASPYSGMGGHSLSVADIDNDGRDEIVYQAMVVDDDGKGLYSTGLRHGDAMHVTDIDPHHLGLEVFTVQENEDRKYGPKTPGAAMRDAHSGTLLWSHSLGVDVGAGLVADIDPRYDGCEVWGGPGGLRAASGESIGPAPRSIRFAVWWDGDLLRELWGRGGISKWDWTTSKEQTLLRIDTPNARYPCLSADLVGDWREEVLVASPDGTSLRLYATTVPTEHRICTLMHDPQYRLSVAWQNVAYNKPPHTSFFLGHGMSTPPMQTIRH